MRDIISALRFTVVDERHSSGKLYRQAADEIEKLHKLLVECRKYVFIECSAAQRTAEAYGDYSERVGRWLNRARKHQALLDRIDAALGEQP